MSVLIESPHNPKIKDLLALLEKPRDRRDTQLFVVEGVREVSMALNHQYILHSLFYLPHLHPNPAEQFGLSSEIPCHPVSPALYKKIAYRDDTEGLVAVMQQKKIDLSDLILPHNPLILVVEQAEKPGNVGAILRTADAAQVDAVLLCDLTCDLYNPNLIRASLGALFTRQVVACSSAEAVAWLQKRGIDIYAATLQDSVSYLSQDYTTGCAIIVGSEAYGLTPVWRNAARTSICIPMLGAIDSLNVSVSAAILMYEAVRQRIKTV